MMYYGLETSYLILIGFPHLDDQLSAQTDAGFRHHPGHPPQSKGSQCNPCSLTVCSSSVSIKFYKFQNMSGLI